MFLNDPDSHDLQITSMRAFQADKPLPDERRYFHQQKDGSSRAQGREAPPLLLAAKLRQKDASRSLSLGGC